MLPPHFRPPPWRIPPRPPEPIAPPPLPPRCSGTPISMPNLVPSSYHHQSPPPPCATDASIDTLLASRNPPPPSSPSRTASHHHPRHAKSPSSSGFSPLRYRCCCCCCCYTARSPPGLKPMVLAMEQGLRGTLPHSVDARRRDGVEVTVWASQGGTERNRRRREGGILCPSKRQDNTLFHALAKRGRPVACWRCQKVAGLSGHDAHMSYLTTHR